MKIIKINFLNKIKLIYNFFFKLMEALGIGDWDWGLGIGIGPNPQSPIPIPNPQSPIPKNKFNLNNYIFISE